jgi:hypothetical protein
VLPKTTNTQVAWSSSASRLSLLGRGTYRKPQPSDEAVVAFKGVMVVAGEQSALIFTWQLEVGMSHSLANPGEGTEYRDDDGHVRDNSGSNHGAVIDRAVPDDVDDLVHKPAVPVSLNRSGDAVRG